MLDDLTKFADHFFASQRLPADALARWLIRQIERIPEPARKYLPLPKSERPETYETVEPGRYD
jgi:hypothetical protein